jgi:hypothetical protein
MVDVYEMSTVILARCSSSSDNVVLLRYTQAWSPTVSVVCDDVRTKVGHSI